ncbi:MAG: C25 family cysteine peptidase [bacterium]|nr:C25 family cysteine peptidase [bacterium]
MKKGSIVLLACLFILMGSALARPWTVDDDIILGIPAENSIQVQTEVLGKGHLRLHFSNPKVSLETIDAEKREWAFINIDGETRRWEEGKPLVPVVSRAIRLPDRGNVELKILSSTFREYTNIDVFPQQLIPELDVSRTGENYLERAFTIDQAAYSNDDWYPGELATLSEPALLRDARTALLGLQPVQVNPVTRTVRVYESIEIETIPIGGVGPNELEVVAGPVPSFEAFYSQIIGAQDLETDAGNSPPGQILIISRNDATVQTIIQPFINWKIASGRPVRSMLWPSNASPTSGVIRDSILSVYNNSANTSTPLEFVIFVGDDGTSGAYSFPAFISGYGCSDHGYSRLVGTDELGEIAIGRFSVDNQTHLATNINRCLNYERTPLMTDTTWFTRGWGYAGTSHNLFSNKSAVRYCLSMMQSRGVTNTSYDEHSSSVSSATISTRLNPGATHWAHRVGYVGEMSTGDVAGVNQNVNKCFVAFNITCSSGNWENAGAGGIHEALIRLGSPSAPAGAVSAVATSTSGTHVTWNNIIATGIYYGYGVLGMHQPGPMLWQGKFQLWRNCNGFQNSQVTSFSQWNNLMGDPTIYMWSGVPRQLNATIPQQISLGQNRLEFTVRRGTQPVADVLVTAWKKNAGGQTETYTRVWTDSTGRVVVPLTNRTTGQMTLTITGEHSEDWYPIVDTIAVNQAPADIGYVRTLIDDDNAGGTNGDGNGLLTPGETADLSVMLANRGSTTAVSGISATLFSDDPRVVITNPTQTWNTLAAGDSANANGSFRMQLLAGLSHGESILLRLQVTASDTNLNRNLGLAYTLSSIDVSHISSAYYNEAGQTTTFTPGGTVRLSVTSRNIGAIAANQVNTSLFSRSPYIAINTSEALLTSLPIGTNVTTPTTERYRISANVLTIPGTIAQMGLAFGNGALRDTVYFNITIGTRTSIDPTGPDGYGYLAYDDRDVSYEMCPTYSWIDINHGLGTRLNINDGGETQDASVALPLPFRVQYFGNTFTDSMTVCSNGWLAFGVERDRNNPTVQPNRIIYDNFRNWHLPANEGPRNMVAPFWDDLKTFAAPGGVYYWYDNVNHLFVVTWNVQLNSSSGQANEFQAIIYDEEFWPTFTNDAMIKFQYKTFNNVAYDSQEIDYCTIGIADNDYRNAVEYTYFNAYTPGSASFTNGTNINRAILFTTAQNFITGTLTGNVRRADNNQPVENATVFVLNGGYSGTTNAQGNYTINEVLIGEYNVRATAEGFNPEVMQATITEDDTTTLNFVLTSPGFSYSPDSIRTTLDPNGQDTTYQITLRNTGNGLLTWNSELLYGGLSADRAPESESPRGPVNSGNAIDETDNPWDQVFTFNASSLTGDMNLNGVEYDGQNFWVTGGNTWLNPNKLYKFNRDGVLLTSFNQPDTLSIYGWRDLAWDGVYLYSSSDRNINQIDTLGHIVRSYPTSVNPARAIAIDTANGLIYYCDRMSPIYVIQMSDGQQVRQFANSGNIYGLAWYPSDVDGMFLYSLQRDASDNGASVVKLDPISGASQLVATIGNVGEKAAGVAMTPRWNPMLWTMACILTTDAGVDRVALFEVAFNTVWIQYSPESGEIAPGDSTSITVNLSSRSMPRGSYRVGIRVNTNANLASVTIPVTMVVDTINAIGEPQHNVALPSTVTLDQNYPNPFNPSTTFSFALPRTERVNFTVYDALGREVARLLAGETVPAGRYSLHFNANELSAGIYFYRIEAGSFTATRKMILMK